MSTRSALFLACVACGAPPRTRAPAPEAEPSGFDTTVVQAPVSDLWSPPEAGPGATDELPRTLFSAPDLRDVDGDGVDNDEDCDDSDPLIHPGQRESCDGIDQDCDGQIDERVMDSWYLDEDGDGEGAGEAVSGCAAPGPTYVADNDDCDDDDYYVHSGASERCDGLDNDCDLAIDEGVLTAWYADTDGDGVGDGDDGIESCETLVPGRVSSAGDCDDGDASTYPGADESCEDGIDSDCDGDDGICEMNTEDLSYADCSAWAPYDIADVSWSWRGESSDMVEIWRVSNAGAGTYAGLSVWVVETSGIAYPESDYHGFWIGYAAELGLTCEEDGLHLVYETHEATWSSEYGDSTYTTSIQFSERPLLLPDTLAEGDSWTVDKASFADAAKSADTYSPSTYTTFEVGGLEAWTLEDEDVEARSLTLTTASGGTSEWWLVEGVGLVGRGAYAVNSVSGL